MGLICSRCMNNEIILSNYSPLIRRHLSKKSKSPIIQQSPKTKLLAKRCTHCSQLYHKKTKNKCNSPNIYCSPECKLMNNPLFTND